MKKTQSENKMQSVVPVNLTTLSIEIDAYLSRYDRIPEILSELNEMYEVCIILEEYYDTCTEMTLNNVSENANVSSSYIVEWYCQLLVRLKLLKCTYTDSTYLPVYTIRSIDKFTAFIAQIKEKLPNEQELEQIQAQQKRQENPYIPTNDCDYEPLDKKTYLNIFKAISTSTKGVTTKVIAMYTGKDKNTLKFPLSILLIQGIIVIDYGTLHKFNVKYQGAALDKVIKYIENL